MSSGRMVATSSCLQWFMIMFECEQCMSCLSLLVLGFLVSVGCVMQSTSCFIPCGDLTALEL